MSGASTESSRVTYEAADGIGLLTLDAQSNRNALSSSVLMSLKSRLEEVDQDGAVRVLVIRSAGAVFSSGHDLRELLAGSEEEHATLFHACTGVMEAIRLLPKPVIAQVQGMATAAGCQLVASCDIAVAAESARFATPGVRNGLFCTTPGVALARAVPQKKAMEMLLTGIPMSAGEALQFGLVSRVVRDDDLEEATMDLARHIARASSYTLATGKRAFYEQLGLDYPQAYAAAERVMTENMQAHDAREGIDAFLTKRKPNWKDR